MMKISNYALTMALLTHNARRTLAACPDGVISTFTGADSSACNYAAFAAGLPADCTPADLFPDLDQTAIEAEVAEICEYDAITQFVEIQGYYQKDRRFFAGGGPLVDGENWGVETGQIGRFENNAGSNQVIAWPEYLARIDYNNANGLGDNGYPANMNLETSCQLKTAMCCFTDDSAGTPFPAGSTTDVCRHDLYDSPQSNHIKEGWSVFPGSETATQCVGFTWEDGDDDLIGNMMYDVSLRQSALHGYRGGVPGAPMCGCVEHMPEVASAQCRTASKNGDISFTFSYSYDAASETGEVSASNTADITYEDCGTDLATAYKNNHADDADKALIDAYLVEDCAADLTEYLNEEQFLHESQDATRYITPDPAKWSDLFVGEGIYFQPPHIEPAVADAEFRALIDGSCGDGSRQCIVRRTCASCRYDSHRDIFYKRLTALPPVDGEADGVYLLDMFMNNWSDRSANTFNVDFELYSSYEDAVAGTKRWTYCDFQADGSYDGYGFPRNCAPTGAVWNQWNSYVHHHGDANHHGFFVEKPAPVPARRLR